MRLEVSSMIDVLYIFLVVLFFAGCIALIAGLEKL